jgi:hypothetical protein
MKYLFEGCAKGRNHFEEWVELRERNKWWLLGNAIFISFSAWPEAPVPVYFFRSTPTG